MICAMRQSDRNHLLSILNLRDWRPDIEEDAWYLMGHCESKLERLYMLGLFWQIHRPVRCGGKVWVIPGSPALFVEPQAQYGPYRIDFLITIYGRTESRQIAVEIDGYSVHRRRACQDAARDRFIEKKYPVKRIRDLESDPLDWAAELPDMMPFRCADLLLHPQGC